jgi:hypothetical protein
MPTEYLYLYLYVDGPQLVDDVWAIPESENATAATNIPLSGADWNESLG